MTAFDDPALLALALGRTAGWVATVPIFGPIRTSATGRIALALALALFVAGSAETAPTPTDAGPFALVLSGQVLYGLLLGWLTSLVVATFEAAGGVIDALGGFSIGAVLDPSTGTQNAVFARFFQLAIVAMILLTNVHMMIVGGFLRSFTVTGPASLPVIGERSLDAVARATADLLLAALEIGAPLIGALLLAEVAMALAARFAPQTNVFLLSLPLKSFIVIALVGNVLVFLPTYTEVITERTLILMGSLR